MRRGVIRFARRFAGRRGFSLLEALAAFTILTAVLGQLLSGVSGAARNETRADFLQRAARQGKSQLDALGADGNIPVGVTQGRYDDGLVWRLSVTQIEAIRGQQPGAATTSYGVDLAIARPNGEGLLTFSTVKVVSTGGQQSPGDGGVLQ